MTQVVSLFGMSLPVAKKEKPLAQRPFIRPEANFDEQGRPVQRRDGEGRVTRYRYDEAGNLARTVEPDGRFRQFVYDTQNRPAAKRDRAGQTTRYGYDEQGRLAEVAGENGRIARFGYDDGGRPTLAANRFAQTRYDYNAAGQVTRQTLLIRGRRYVTEYAYGEKGHCIGVRPPGSGAWLRYEYNDRGHLVAVRAGDHALLNHAHEDGCVHTTFGNGVVAEHTLRRGRGLACIRAGLPGDEAAFFDWRLVYDRDHNVIRAGERRFVYDDKGQLIVARRAGQTTRYTYDGAGNRCRRTDAAGETTYAYDALDRLTAEKGADGTIRYRYDENGHLTSRCRPRETTTYGYDADGRLVKVARNGRTVARYAYNAQGHRLWAQQGDRIVIEHRDLMGQLLAETTPDGRALATYVRAGGRVAARIAGPVGSEDVVYYHLDHLGSTWAVTDENGRVCHQNDYTPFGRATAAEVGGWRFGFAGYEWSEQAGLYYAGARWYDAEIGRFITPDTYTYGPDDPRQLWGLRDPKTAAAWMHDPRRCNRYVYCLNNPATYVDIDGHDALGVFLTIIGFIWALPATVFGFVLWLVLEILLIVPLILSLTGVFQSLGVSGHSSGMLETFALFFEGGMIGSIMNATSGGAWKAFTCGYTVFILESEAGNRSTICHELRHTNQYGWFGPFFALPAIIAPFITLPTLGIGALVQYLQNERVTDVLLAGTLIPTLAPLLTVYFWDWAINGYDNAWAERDAQAFEIGC